MNGQGKVIETTIFWGERNLKQIKEDQGKQTQLTIDPRIHLTDGWWGLITGTKEELTKYQQTDPNIRILIY